MCSTTVPAPPPPQVLFSKADVGRPKVEAALDGLQHHNICTELVAHNLDAIDHWAAGKGSQLGATAKRFHTSHKLTN